MEHLIGGAQPITFQSFAEAMAGNMTEPEKAKTLQIVGNAAGTGTVSWTNMDQVKSAWAIYFDAEFEVNFQVVQLNLTCIKLEICYSVLQGVQ